MHADRLPVAAAGVKFQLFKKRYCFPARPNGSNVGKRVFIGKLDVDKVHPGINMYLFCAQTISRLDPKFVALHCQEVGGKNYEKSMQYVDKFVQILLASEELRLFNKVRIYLDEDFTSADKFTVR